MQNYDDERYNIVSRHSRDAPNWTYIEQSMSADTDFSELETPIQTKKNLMMADDAEGWVEMDKLTGIEKLAKLKMNLKNTKQMV
jgi:hypothetical protein